MRTLVKVTPIAVSLTRLSAIATRRKSMFGAPKSSWRRPADGCGTTEITRRTGKANRPDPTRQPPLPAVTVQRVIDLALAAARSEHWTGRRLAKAVGVSLRSVQRILEMRPRIVRSPSTFASAPGRAMQRSHALWGSAITNGRHLLRSR